MSSPYEVVLGDLVPLLSPALRTYFSAIPAGSVGVGEGVFDRVGTPRRWLRPVLRLLARDGVIAPVWLTDVPFTVVNSPLDRAVSATRTFRFPGGDWAMVDEIGIQDGALVDVLGRSRRLVATLHATVADGALELRSTALHLRLGGIRLRVPKFFAPTVSLTERFDGSEDRQHVTLTLDSPLLGRLYEYSGSFVYGLRVVGGAVTDRIVIAGASGFIGTFLAEAFTAGDASVSTIGRTGDATWGDTAAIARLVDGADLLLNLAGKSVSCRYTPANRAEIFRSRLETTRQLSDAVVASATPPPLWINSSTATIYRHAEDRPMTESTGELGEGFSVEVAKAWERELFAAHLRATRRVALRMAIVLGDGSALSPLLRLARLGLGGPQLDGPWIGTRDKREAGAFHQYRHSRGHQMFSWIHLDDVLGIIRFLRTHDLEGAINASSPHPVDDTELMATLRRAVGAPFGIPAPRFALEAGTLLLRSESELLLKSRWVVPERLLEAGYEFQFPDVAAAVRDILTTRKQAA